MLPGGRPYHSLDAEDLTQKLFEAIKQWSREAIEQWARDVNGAQTKVAAILAEYELRGLEPPPLETVPGWQLITAAALGAVNNMSQELKDEIGRDVCVSLSFGQKGKALARGNGGMLLLPIIDVLGGNFSPGGARPWLAQPFM